MPRISSHPNLTVQKLKQPSGGKESKADYLQGTDESAPGPLPRHPSEKESSHWSSSPHYMETLVISLSGI